MVSRDARAAVALAAGVVVPACVGLVVARYADGVDESDAAALARLTTAAGVGAGVAVAAQLATLAATLHLARGRFAASMLSQPSMAFAALKVVASLVLLAGVFWHDVRQPPVFFAVAIVDAAAVATTLLLLGPMVARAPALASGYVVYRLAFALMPFASAARAPELALVHRLTSVVVVAAVAVAFAQAARRLRAAP